MGKAWSNNVGVAAYGSFTPSGALANFHLDELAGYGYGVTPTRDAAVIGLQAGARLADKASLFLRYDGELSSATDNHALNVGLRFELVIAPRRAFLRRSDRDDCDFAGSLSCRPGRMRCSSETKPRACL